MVDVADFAVEFSTYMRYVLCAIIATAFLTAFIVVAYRLYVMLIAVGILVSAAAIFTFNINAEFSLACAILNAPTIETFRLKSRHSYL